MKQQNGTCRLADIRNTLAARRQKYYQKQINYEAKYS